MKFSLTNQFKEKLKDEIKNQNVDFIKRSFDGISYIDITELLSEFNSVDSKYVIDNIDIETSTMIISELDEDDRKNFLKYFRQRDFQIYNDNRF